MLTQKLFIAIKKFFSPKTKASDVDIFGEDRFRKHAGAFITHQFIEVKAYAQRRIVLFDPTVQSIVLALDASEEILGQAMLDALKQSRFLSHNEKHQIYSGWKSYRQNWATERMQQFGYKSKDTLFRYMDYCSIESFNGKITIEPTTHERLEMWGRERNDGIEDIVLPDTATPTEIGAALRLAFRRCVTKKGKVIVDNPNIPFEERKQQWVPEARVFATPHELEVVTYSRYGLSVKDTAFSPVIFSSDASCEQLGEALRQTLDQSRFLSYEEAEKLLVKTPQAQKEWAIERQAQWGYATKRALLAKMQCCFITQSNDHIILKPSHHEKLESWNPNLPDNQTVTVPTRSTPSELGQALWLALTRCTSKVR